MPIKIIADSKRTDHTKWQTDSKERHNVQLCKTLTGISPVIHFSNNRYIKNVNRIPPRFNSYLNSKGLKACGRFDKFKI